MSIWDFDAAEWAVAKWRRRYPNGTRAGNAMERVLRPFRRAVDLTAGIIVAILTGAAVALLAGTLGAILGPWMGFLCAAIGFLVGAKHGARSWEEHH